MHNMKRLTQAVVHELHPPLQLKCCKLGHHMFTPPFPFLHALDHDACPGVLTSCAVYKVALAARSITQPTGHALQARQASATSSATPPCACLQHGCEDVAGAVCKRAVLCNLQAVQLNNCIGLSKALLDAAQEGLCHLLLMHKRVMQITHSVLTVYVPRGCQQLLVMGCSALTSCQDDDRWSIQAAFTCSLPHPLPPNWHLHGPILHAGLQHLHTSGTVNPNSLNLALTNTDCLGLPHAPA